MCGIGGIVDPSGVGQKEIEALMAPQGHRGPDGGGSYVGKNFGLGHKRLSIIDLETGTQPISNENERYWITLNGELYNYKVLKKELTANHTFKTQSDTEVLVHLYEEHQEDCLKYLRGMFAFGIYDKQQDQLFLARDHLGQKPLYYYHDEHYFAFSSEIKGLLSLHPKLKEMDLNALYEYLNIRIITSPRSMFKNIRKLPPGHFLIFKNGQVTIERYWHLTFTHKKELLFEDAVEELDQKLRETIQYHLVSDVPVGAFLSGGLDSSLITAIMSGLVKEPVKTFSGEVPYAQFSELPYARAVSEKYQTEHHELTINPTLMSTLAQVVSHLDEPSDSLSLCMYHISQLTAEKVKVVLGGDGGDELFGGYDRYYGNIQVSYYAMLPEFIRKKVFKKILDLFPERFWYRSMSHKLKWMHQMSFYQAGTRYAKSLGYFYFSNHYGENIFTDQLRKSVSAFNPDEALKEYFDASNAEDIVDKMLYTDAMTRMPDHPVMIQDRMTMAHGLEARSPFLDHKLVEFCASLPSHFKIKGKRLRFIQHALAKKYLPQTVLTRKKQGFSSALPYILSKEYTLLYNALLRDSHLVATGNLNGEAIKSLLRDHINKKVDHGNRLWLLCNAELWYRMYIEDLTVDEVTNLIFKGFQ